jgi:hypothetical protein
MNEEIYAKNKTDARKISAAIMNRLEVFNTVLSLEPRNETAPLHYISNSQFDHN